MAQGDSGKARRKPVSSYDQPTPEKRAYGARMRHAREMAGLTQDEAAKRMGYAQAVQLSNMEAGNRMPPLHVLVQAAKLYGTTMDYLCGLADDADRDPASAMVRHVSGRITSELNRLIDVMVSTGVDTARKVLPTAAEGQRLASLVLEAQSGLRTFRSRNPKFEAMPAGALLESRMDLAAEAARRYVDGMERARRVLQARVNGPGSERPQLNLLPALAGGADVD